MNIKKQKSFRDYLELFFVLLFGLALFFGELFKKIQDFNLIHQKDVLGIACCCTFLCTLLIFLFVITRKSYSQKMKTWIWLTNHIEIIDLCYVLPLMFLLSIKSSVVCDKGDLKDIVSVSWTIFGVIITIFAFWYVLIPKYLKAQRPKFEEYLSKQAWQKLYDKGEYYEKVSIFFLPAKWVTISLFLLVIATNAIYLATKEITWISQTIVRFSFYFCANTVLLIFFDVIKTFKEEKQALLKDAYVSKEEIETQAEKEENREVAQKLLRVLDSVSTLEADTKENIRLAVSKHFDVREDC